MRPFPLEIAAGDFAFATDHRHVAISFMVGASKPVPWPPQS
jgi:hypothetical protein